MSLATDLELNRPFDSRDEELILSLLLTHRLMEQVSTLLLARYELTPTQFNALMIVRDYEKQGIRQTELARRLLINRASAGTLVDNLCARELLCRRPVPGDRRAYHLRLTARSRRLLVRVLKPYYRRVERILSRFPVMEKTRTLRFLDQLRGQLSAEQAELAGSN